jgi:DNA-directed RNA polymerase subunit RPC12/RpoP
MPAFLDCPATESWERLLASAVPPDQWEQYERHMESCSDCQDRLDQIEECGDTLWQLAQRFGDPTGTPTDPTLVNVMERLHEVKSPGQQPTTASGSEMLLPLAEDCPRVKETGSRRGVLQRLSLPTWFAGLVVLGLTLVLLAQAALPPFQKPPVETNQDFRKGQPLLPSLKLFGGDAVKLTKREDEGLRITLPPTRKNHDAVGVSTSYSLSGDFVITAAYELLSASRPTQGPGTGVTLRVANDPQWHSFAKVGRFIRPAEGSGYATEFWNNNPPPDKVWQAQFEPSEGPRGQLRLVREGSILRFLVADGPENTFRQIDVAKIGADDLPVVQFVVVDSGTEGNLVDARLIELKIRSGALPQEERSATAPLPEQERPAGSNGGSTLVKLFGLIIACALATALGGFLYWRRSRRLATTPLPAAGPNTSAGMEAMPLPISFSCAACSKQLKARAELAGKKVRCSQCGKAVLVPMTKAIKAARSS